MHQNQKWEQVQMGIEFNLQAACKKKGRQLGRKPLKAQMHSKSSIPFKATCK